MTNKQVLSAVDSIRKGWYNPPSNYYGFKKAEFEFISYSRSAIGEIYLCLLENQNKNPIDTIEEFRSKMDDFACYAQNGMANFMFSVYYDVATDVLDTLLNMR